MKYKILEHWPNADNWQVGDIVDISNAEVLLKEGKVEVYEAPKPKAEPKAEPKVAKKKSVSKKSK